MVISRKWEKLKSQKVLLNVLEVYLMNIASKSRENLYSSCLTNTKLVILWVWNEHYYVSIKEFSVNISMYLSQNINPVKATRDRKHRIWGMDRHSEMAEHPAVTTMA